MSPSLEEIVWTVVVAGGSGARFGAAKQYATIGDRRMVDLAIAAAEPVSAGVVVVVPAGDVSAETARSERRIPPCSVVAGGATRSASVRSGLAAVPPDATVVCVHDAARPFATPELFATTIEAVVAGADGAVPGVPVTDTVKVVDPAGRVVATPDRATLVAVQTPQAFRADVLRRAHATSGEGSDDAALVERCGGTVVVVPGLPSNRKVTHADDLAWARAQAGVA